MLEMRAINLTHDYPLLKKWWEARKFPAANPEFMPPTGVLVSIYEKPVAAGFLFKSDANAAIIGNIVSNPEAPGSDRHQALDVLIETLIRMAKSGGFKMVCCSTNLPRLMARFEAHGLTKEDEQVSHFGRVL